MKMRAWLHSALLVLAGAMVVHFAALPIARAEQRTTGPAGANAKPAKSATKPRPPCKGLPEPVREMREAILAAVRSGDITELLVPIQWNELPPDFGYDTGAKPVAQFKKLSIDGEGREILAILGNLLSVPCTVVREGSDIENNKVYVWPYFARLPFRELAPKDQVVALAVLPRDVYAEMKTSGQYPYWSISIGADGTWHSFKRTKKRK